MTGLEKILKAIEEDATTIANAEIAKANEKAEKILALAKQEADEKCREIIEQSKENVNSSLSRAESAANLQEKKLILKAKQEVITDVIESARKKLIMLDKEEYFKVIIKMIRKHALNKDGKIIFNASDLKRIPEGLEESIKEALKDKENATLTIAEHSASIDGGFILVYGDVEINCSFESLFLSAKETLQDKVCEVLFN